jgi:hypothetical protein
MLKLTYSRKKDRSQIVTVIGDADGIRDLYWQLTHNYDPKDGTAIGSIKISDLDGVERTEMAMVNPHGAQTRLSTI